MVVRLLGMSPLAHGKKELFLGVRRNWRVHGAVPVATYFEESPNDREYDDGEDGDHDAFCSD